MWPFRDEFLQSRINNMACEISELKNEIKELKNANGDFFRILKKDIIEKFKQEISEKEEKIIELNKSYQYILINDTAYQILTEYCDKKGKYIFELAYKDIGYKRFLVIWNGKYWELA